MQVYMTQLIRSYTCSHGLLFIRLILSQLLKITRVSLLQKQLEAHPVSITLPTYFFDMVLPNLQPVVHMMLQQVLRRMTTVRIWGLGYETLHVLVRHRDSRASVGAIWCLAVN